INKLEKQMNQKNDPSRTGNPLINDPTSLILRKIQKSLLRKWKK
ncbi:hypothetical protein HOLDEFILI_00534, partial [Holdemania filiformis DSM 12042]